MSSMVKWCSALALCSLVWGCSSEADRFCGDEPSDGCVVDQRVTRDVPEPAAGEGIKFTSPELLVPPGEERQLCWVLDWVPDQDVFVHTMNTYQGALGHHVGGFVSLVDVEPGEVFDCTAIETMAGMRPLVLPDGTYRGDDFSQIFEMPDRFTVRIGANSKVVMQSHYVNTTGHELLFQDVVTLTFDNNPEGRQVAGYYILNDSEITLPAHAASTRKLHCDFDQETNIFVAFGHMHEWGTSIFIEGDKQGAREMLWSVDKWDIDFRDAPPITTWDTDAPMQFMPGDTLHLECNYMNIEDHELVFPTEMCTALAMYWPADRGTTAVCDHEYDN